MATNEYVLRDLFYKQNMFLPHLIMLLLVNQDYLNLIIQAFFNTVILTKL